MQSKKTYDSVSMEWTKKTVLFWKMWRKQKWGFYCSEKSWKKDLSKLDAAKCLIWHPKLYNFFSCNAVSKKGEHWRLQCETCSYGTCVFKKKSGMFLIDWYNDFKITFFLIKNSLYGAFPCFWHHRDVHFRHATRFYSTTYTENKTRAEREPEMAALPRDKYLFLVNIAYSKWFPYIGESFHLAISQI